MAGSPAGRDRSAVAREPVNPLCAKDCEERPMCGLVGVVGGASEAALRTAVQRMSDRLRHRGPDDHETLARRGGRRGARPSTARDRRPLAGRPSADGLGLRPVDPRLQRRNLQSREPARRARARGHGAGLAWTRRHGDGARLLRRLGNHGDAAAIGGHVRSGALGQGGTPPRSGARPHG